jgi:hypothetical protein
VARDFTADVANYMTLGANALGPLLNGAAAVSLSLFYNVDTYPANGTSGRDMLFVPIDGASSGLSFTFARISNINRIRIGGRSVIGDTFRQLDSPQADAAGGIHWAGGVWDFVGDNLRIYQDGSQVATGTSGVFGNTSYTNGTPTAHDGIGCATTTTVPISTARQADGRLHEVAIWAGDIGSDGYAQVHKGFSPLLVRPDLLVFYMPIIGQYSPEPDIVGGLSGTITGSLPVATHVSVYRPYGPYAIADDAPSAAGNRRRRLLLAS